MSIHRTRPILFSGAMVRAILEGRKTQTRRPIKPAVWNNLDPEDSEDRAVALAGSPFDPYTGLWVRETWAPCVEGLSAFYRATHESESTTVKWTHAIRHGGKWRPSIHMPRWASRLMLQVTKVRIERLAEISEEDAVAEGFSNREQFLAAWDSMYAKRGLAWRTSPLVWAITFEVAS